MTLVSSTIIVLLLAAITPSPAAAQPPPASSVAVKTGTIRGRITAADSGRPLRRVRITIRSESSASRGAPMTVNTNSLGQFEAKDLPPGSYYVSASRAGYLPVEYGQRRVGERGLTGDVRAGEAAERIDLALPRGGVIAGRILDELGEPYPGVRIDVLGQRYDRGRRVPFPAGTASTDDLGQFRFAPLPPGSYYVAATSTETWKTDKKETYGYASTYFPGGTPDQVQAVTLAPSEQRLDLSFSLHASRAVRISGRLVRENGDPIASGQVTMAYSYPGVIMTSGMRSVRAGADGSFEFRDVAGGTYQVGPETVTVAGADIDDLVLVSRTGSTVMGTVVTENGAPPPFESSGVRILNEATTDNVLPRVAVASVERDWSFKFGNLGGSFLFRVIGLPDGWMLGAVRLNDKDITDVAWDVPTGSQQFSGLQMEVTQKVGRLTGSVVDSNGKPSPAATVVVFADDAGLWTPYSRFIRMTRPGADGRFSIVGLAAGTYRVIARDYIENGQWEDRQFLESVRDDGQRIILPEGGAEAVTLKLPAAK